ncbi:MAG: hypothetical protein R3E79_58325 [Caldilineaceae bacterium]
MNQLDSRLPTWRILKMPRRNMSGSLVGALLLLGSLFALPTLVRAWQVSNVQNLLTNGDFEAGNTEDWIFCGGAKLVDAQTGATSEMVYAGRYALRLGQPIDDSCGNGALGPSQIAAEDVTIPANASDTTLSFWYSPTGDWPAGEITIQLSTKPTNNLGSRAVISTLKMDDLMPGWQLFRQNLNADQMAAVRGQTLYLTFWVQFKGQPDWNWAIYVDDVRMAAAWERTEVNAFPADLAGDGQQPLVVLGRGATANTFGIQRMDTDGGHRVVIAEEAVQPKQLTWSPDGQQIAYATDRIFPANSDNDHFPALVSDVHLINATGGSKRTLFFTTGGEGQKETPRGCLPTRTCSDSGRDAIDVKVADIEWSPDNRQILSSLCVEPRWYNGDKATRGCAYHLALQPLPTANAVDITLPKFIDVAQNGSWASTNRILFQRPGSIGTNPLPSGVWEVDMAQQPPQPTLVQTWLTGYAGSNELDLRAGPELEPTWAPDGRHFVTYRPAQGVRYVEKIANDVTLSALRSNYTIMLHDRKDPTVTRMLLYVDQGTLIARPTWSPDGRYLLYVVLADNGESADIWWLNVATGATGRVTNDGLSYEVDWQPTHQLTVNPTPTSGPTATANPALTGGFFYPWSTVARRSSRRWLRWRFWCRGQFPDPHAHADPHQPTGARESNCGAAARDFRAPILSRGAGCRRKCAIGGLSDWRQLRCESAHRYRRDRSLQLPYAPTYNGAFAYQVTYRNGPEGNNATDSRYLLVWQEPPLLDYDYAQRVEGGSFDIGNVALISPADNAVIPSPATFTWQSRGIAGDRYQWFIDATFDSGLCDQQEPGTNTSFTFSGLGCSIFPELPANEPYQWYVVVHGESGGSGQSQKRTVTFTK